MINEGLTIMGVGMLVVFAFLIIMVLAMGLMSRFVAVFFHGNKTPVHEAQAVACRHEDSELAIAIAAAHTLLTDESELAIAVAVAHSN